VVAEIAGFRMSELLPDEMAEALVGPLVLLAERWGIPREKLAEMAETLDIDPLDLLVQIKPSRTSTVRH